MSAPVQDTPVKSEQERIDVLLAEARATVATEPPRAAELASQALDAARTAAYRAGEATGLLYLGMARAAQLDTQGALASLEEARGVYAELGDKAGEDTATFQMGDVHYDLSQFGLAIECYQQYLKGAEERQDDTAATRALCNLGNVYYALDQYGDALDHYSRSLAKVREASAAGLQPTPGAMRLEDILLNNIGNLYLDTEDFGRAVEFFGTALSRRPGELTVQLNLGTAYHYLKDYPRALELHEDVLKSARAQGDRAVEAYALESIAMTRDELGERDTALSLHREALAIRQDVGDENGVASSHLKIGNLALEIGDRGLALTCLGKALNSAEELGARDCVAEAHLGLSHYYRGEGDFEAALEHHERFHAVKLDVVREQAEKRATSLGIELNAERSVHEAEVARLKTRIEQLTIEIDYSRRDKQVSEVVDSEAFQALKQRAKELRRRMSGTAT
jgi:tetratricopeptide (TPR) repeat protein